MAASVPIPKIIYPSGGGSTLTFLYPPTNVPYRSYGADRKDNYSSAGVREVVFARIDVFIEFDIEYARIGADVAGWDSFMQYALQGGAFDFYPDNTLNNYSICVLEDKEWDAAYKQLSNWSFHPVFRKLRDVFNP